MSKDIKKRIWWFILYPESAPKNWKYDLEMTGIPFAVSPLHDKDIFTIDDCDDPDKIGKIKKPHYHVIVAFDGPTTYSNVVNTITKPFNATSPKYIDKIRGPYAYLCHLKHPDKAKYNPEDIELFNDFDVNKLIKVSIEEEDLIFNDIENIILENNLTEFFLTVKYLKCNGLLEYLSFFRRHTIYFKEYINSVRYYHYDDFGGIV